LAGAGAWLLGAAAATCGSLLAVSMLGKGIAATPSQQQLTTAMVNQALAREGAETASRLPAPAPAPSPSVRLGGVAMPITRATPVPSEAPVSPQAGTLLSSAGGTVVVLCEQAGAYLQSWSPQQGYEANSVVRGPSGGPRVSFITSQRKVTMLLSCQDGVPKAAVHTTSWGGRDE
jgi:hypothetical protein